LARVPGTDLLLFAIIVLGAMRLAAGAANVLTPSHALIGPAGNSTATLILVLAMLAIQAIVVLVAVRAVILRRHGLSWRDLGLRRVSSNWYSRAVLLAIMLVPVAVLINAWLGRLAGAPIENPQLYAVAPIGFSWGAFAAMSVMAGVVAPLAEEIAFRGLVFAWLRVRVGVLPGALLSAVAFASLHGVPALIPALTVIGFALALIYQRSGSLWPAVIAHGVFNTIMIAMLYAALAAGRGAP